MAGVDAPMVDLEWPDDAVIVNLRELRRPGNQIVPLPTTPYKIPGNLVRAPFNNQFTGIEQGIVTYDRIGPDREETPRAVHVIPFNGPILARDDRRTSHRARIDVVRPAHRMIRIKKIRDLLGRVMIRLQRPPLLHEGHVVYDAVIARGASPKGCDGAGVDEKTVAEDEAFPPVEHDPGTIESDVVEPDS